MKKSSFAVKMNMPLSLSTFSTQNHSANRRGERASSSSGQIKAHGVTTTRATTAVSKYCLVRQCEDTIGSNAIVSNSMTGSTSPSERKQMPRPVPSQNPAINGRRADIARAYRPIARPASKAVSVINW